MRNVGMIFLLASIPLVAGDSVGAAVVNQGGPAVAKRNLTEAETQSTLQALGVSPSSTSGGIKCDVENSAGIVTNTVPAANYPVAAAFWLRYQPGNNLTKQVRFLVAPLFTGSPLAAQTQVFNPNSTSEVVTPFGIPAWGSGLTAGPWILVVQNDLGESTTFKFTVQ